eukprot:EG_transcript_9070
MQNPIALCTAPLEVGPCLASDGSDYGSSEDYSSEGNDGTPTSALRGKDSGFLSHLTADVLASRRNAHHPRLPRPTATAIGGAPVAPPAGERRQLCLDFLNGKCARHRSRCRFYHPEPTEISVTSADNTGLGTFDPSRPICEVWTLTGFCKFGPRCWKQHPQLAAQLATPLAEPVTQKFREWLQRRVGATVPPPSTGGSACAGGLPRAGSLGEPTPRSAGLQLGAAVRRLRCAAVLGLPGGAPVMPLGPLLELRRRAVALAQGEGAGASPISAAHRHPSSLPSAPKPEGQYYVHNPYSW